MLSSSYSFRPLNLLIPLIFIFGTSIYLCNTPRNAILPGFKSLFDGPLSGKKESFVQRFLDSEIDGPYNASPLAELCGRADWTPGLIVKCMPPPGGVGNVMNMLLNCLRFAFEAGATGLIIPEITVRGDDLANINTDVVLPLGYFFDVEHFITSLTTTCPQIHLYRNQSEFPSTATEIDLVPKSLSNSFHPVATTVIAAPGNWSSEFHSWLNAAVPPFSATNPVLVTFSIQLLRFPLNYDDPAFVATFGRIFRFREDVRRLAAAVLYSMSTKYLLNLDFSKSGIQRGKFYGAHLRTAKDAAAVGWPGYEEQQANYFSATMNSNLSLIYLTTGNPDDAVRFNESGRKVSIDVATKVDLLSEAGFEIELREMENLTWDQRGLIDYEVLLRSSVFGGMFESSFSWNVALRRHVVVGEGKWETIAHGKQGVGDGKGPEAFKDAFSAIFGPVALGIRWNFPLALWP